MTVQGNIAAIKCLVIQNDRNFPNKTDPIQTLRQEHAKLFDGFPFTPLSFATLTARSLDGSRRPSLVPDVPLSGFILYWPYFLRFYEVHKMSRYMHLLRFIIAHYVKGVAGNSYLAISDYNIDGKGILNLVGFILSGSPDIATEHCIEILPLCQEPL
ncbi:hypothetical protein CEP54_015710 [Fusarium duplospermum]|uniref:Uncharacterized protein n=1 Tax=Fusarium duplospermum TaxID=1325734 RepID=A0A428NLZ0_9HYPO|nr:hypothetical protein CEP54_015710 [Fusarium duplospermum]